jgi:hypothetical protein
MPGVSDFGENKLLDLVFNGPSATFVSADAYVGLNTADPGETGANEATGGSYARQQTAFPASSAGTLANTSNIDFVSMPAVGGNGIVAWSVWDAVSAGTNLWNGWFSTVSGLAECRSGDLATDDIQSVAHGLATDDRVEFETIEGLTIPAGITAGTLYFVLASGLTTDAFRISTTSGGGTLNITAAGSAVWRKVTPKLVNSGDTFRVGASQLNIFLD